MDGDIVEVLASDYIKELKTGAWKKQLSLLSTGGYLVEVYWVPWISEAERPERWERIFSPETHKPKASDNEHDARLLYAALTNMAPVSNLLFKVAEKTKRAIKLTRDPYA